MRLHHVTSVTNRQSIAAHGFWESEREHATGVFLSPPGFLWQAGGLTWIGDGPVEVGAGEAAYGFDIPDDQAAEFAVYQEMPHHPATPFERDAEGLALYEFCVPAEVANRYCVGVVAT